MNPHVLVCGGAGYIGSHMCKTLAGAGFIPVTFDNLSTGHRWAVNWGPLIEGDMLDRTALDTAFSKFPVAAVLHFAAKSLVAESMREPDIYVRNNADGTRNLLAAMRAAGVDRLVFSSTAAVYGNPRYVPIDERHPADPINPYGHSKLLAEAAIADACQTNSLRAVCLRYFNAAGCEPNAGLGEVHEPETHLIPNLVKAALSPESHPARIYGDDYDTPDGTCVRDYVHVSDLCEAHLLALDYLASRPGVHVFNLGTGRGSSVAEVLHACRLVTGSDIQERRLARREGDPPILVATADAARTALGWTPRHELLDCIRDTFAWQQRT